MILLIGSQKGGCGKSTTAVNICAALSMKGKDTVLVDADRQSTAATWITDRREHEKLSTVHCVQKYGNIRDTLLDLNNRYKYVIVDTAGHDSRELRTGMTAAHILLIPFRPSQPDLDTLNSLNKVIEQAKDLNPDLIVYGMLTMAPTNPVVHEVDEAREYLKDYPGIYLLHTIIRDRKVYRDAISLGKGVVEMDNKKAAQETQLLMEELFQW